ncbi:hypothetical protein P872_21500 [Rhodonellum psychrophilum GCM71 = DSM 17998]|uniref:Uncharacterized protein n=1 Tax=Rhodonellum psychrophilum GCM71 = DSM 17998 TaxID=1123057 RepID=U5BXN1_9BACT|nr:hypothetical protein P872_21500 [Rhodonellum psychrophilum GCM71 = DSM 17998]
MRILKFGIWYVVFETFGFLVFGMWCKVFYAAYCGMVYFVQCFWYLKPLVSWFLGCDL